MLRAVSDTHDIIIVIYLAVVDAIVQHGVKRRAGGILPPPGSERILLKLAEVSPVAEKLVRKLIGLEEDDNIEDMRGEVFRGQVIFIYQVIARIIY